MRKTVLALAIAAPAIALPTAAQAQDVVPGSGFVAVTAGIHDLNVEDEVQAAVVGLEINDSSPIFGIAAGYDVPVGTGLFAGVEGNFNLGTDAIDSEYGLSGRLGFAMPGGAKVYGRVGYQWIDLDLNAITGADDFDFSDFDDTDGDVMVGAGVDVPLGKTFIRANIDTVSFDTLRGTVGVGMRF
ncbi:outer membrane beta-barrel protein [Qipengyuania sp. RANM35]|uniref:outer membrane beta-barrel protein n=1 Tax=Qipengyuania sp. RANM35 TaxID=3068635 RepID=UPI0034DAEA2D